MIFIEIIAKYPNYLVISFKALFLHIGNHMSLIRFGQTENHRKIAQLLKECSTTYAKSHFYGDTIILLFHIKLF